MEQVSYITLGMRSLKLFSDAASCILIVRIGVIHYITRNPVRQETTDQEKSASDADTNFILS